MSLLAVLNSVKILRINFCMSEFVCNFALVLSRKAVNPPIQEDFI